ncbi:hypothetical protein [Dyella sp. GSA-30]|uniref:hypothetical protein n=1 Tax=Dyella sp. GSA-30 TaxID=2994496 RepID=UPI0024923321|nr:hypothetical protein [Dyella sp. GSA-30]BDU22182.1 hypothetical protein DYGSA30_36390 [Dyella sp. GSA-30]
MVDSTHDQAADAAIQASVKLIGDVSAHAVQDMTERMASLVAESATRYFNGDTKAALAAQAVLLKQMANHGVVVDDGASQS